MFTHDLFDRLLAYSNDIQPKKNGPKPVFFTHVIGAGAETLFATKGDAPGVQQIAKELPPCRRLEALEAHHACDMVDRLTGRHRSCNASESVRISRNERRIGRKNRETVGRRHKETPAEYHVAITIAIGGGAEVRRIRTKQLFDQIVRIREIRIRVTTTKIREWHTVDDSACSRAQSILQNFVRVRSCDCVHRVKAQAKVAGKQRANCSKVKERLHQRRILGDRVHDLDAQRVVLVDTDRVERNQRQLRDTITGERRGAFGDSLGERFGGRAAIARVVLDAEVAIGTPRVVAGGKNDSAGTALPNEMRRGGGGKPTVLAHDRVRDTVRGGHAQNRLHGFAIEKTTVATNHQRCIGGKCGIIEQRLHKVFEIMRLLKDHRAFAQP